MPSPSRVVEKMQEQGTSPRPGACKICNGKNVRYLCAKGPARYHVCQDCGLILQYPPPGIREMQQYADTEYEAGLYRDYLNARSIKIPHFESRFKAMEPYISGGRLLDIGCSCGYFMEVAAKRGFEVTGLEFSPTAIAAASPGIRAQIRQGTIDDADLAWQDSFNVITAFDLIEHIDQPIAFLRKAVAFLRPGGIIAVSTPDAEHFLRYAMRSSWPMLQPMQHLSIFSKKALRQAFETLGLRLLTMEPAYKTITFTYLVGQLRTLNPTLYAALNKMTALAPRTVLERPRQVNIGEIFAVAVRI